MSSQSVILYLSAIVTILVLIGATEARFVRRSRFHEDTLGGYDPSLPHATGERAIMTVRGTRNPYDGSAPSKITIEDNPYRGAYPRGVYNRLDSGYGRIGRTPIYPSRDLDYASPYGGYGQRGSSMYGAPNRIAVTGVFPYGYGSNYP